MSDKSIDVIWNKYFLTFIRGIKKFAIEKPI